MSRADGRDETLAIPDSVRAAVDERDQLHCRMCGKFLGDRRALHHIIFGGDARGMGGRRIHNINEIVTVCWLPGDNDCHNTAHALKFLFQPLLLQVINKPTRVTALQLLRWQRRQDRTKP